MLSKQIFNVLKLSKNKITLRQNVLAYSSIEEEYYKEKLKGSVKHKEHDPEELKKEEKQYGMKMYKAESIISDDYVDKKNIRRPFYEMNIELFKFIQADVEFTSKGIHKFLSKKVRDKEIRLQELKDSNVKKYGRNVAAAYFIIYAGGKFRFKNNDKWFGENKEDDTLLPIGFDPSYMIVEIDMNDVDIYYEGLMNFEGCTRIKRASFQRSPHFDDWFADRLTHLMPQIEYLDLSECPRLSERGLEAFYKLSSLKNLIVTNNHKTAAFELTCFMLEDVVPKLKVTVLEPKEDEKHVNKN